MDNNISTAKTTANSTSNSDIKASGCVKQSAIRIGIVLIALFLVLLILSILIMAAVPPVSRDALTHHLAIPKLWVAHGGIVEMPDLIFSYYPMNLDLLYAIPLWFGNDIIPKYIHFLFAIATAWLIYIFLKQRTTQTLSLVGVLLFLSTPVIVKLSISVYVDLGLIFFSWASLFHLCQWARCPQSPKHLIISAIFCGLGLGTKYNGLIVCILLTLFIAVIYIRASNRAPFKIRRVIGFPILYFSIAMAVFSPWMIKNYSLTGNPIYPLYRDHTNPGSDRSSISNMSMKPWLQRKLIYKESAVETALIPLRIFFQGKDDDPRFFDGRLNPILLLCPLLLLLKRKDSDETNRREQVLLAAFSVLFLFYASFMVDMRIRYIAPIIPPLVVLSVLGIRDMLVRVDDIDGKGMRRLGRWAITGSVFIFLCLNVVYVRAVFQSVNPLPYIFGKITRVEYLSKHLPEYPAIQFANQLRHDQMKILALFLGNRLYYFDKPVAFATQRFERTVADTTLEMTLGLGLQKDGFTHCVLGINHFETWANRVFNDEQKANLSKWLRDDCTLLFSENGYAVFSLISNGVARSTKHQKGNVE